MPSALTALWSHRKLSTMACGSAASSVVRVISTRLQVERMTASADALARFQIGQSGGQSLLAEGQTFAHLDGCCLVAHTCDQQLHCFSRRFPRRACAAHVTAEKPTTVKVMMAALRPRHPAVTRRQTMAR